MSKRDYYEVLGVGKKASGSEIKKAYRKLAKQFHPDKNPGDKASEDRFREATEAYEILKDPKKKGQYDTYGHQGPRTRSPFGAGNPFASGPFNFSFTSNGMGGFNVNMAGSPFFRNHMGTTTTTFTSRVRTPKRQKADDIFVTISLTLEEMATGCTKVVEYNRQVLCSECLGKEGRRTECLHCMGSGLQGLNACERCVGKGYYFVNDCKHCGDNGVVREKSTMTLPVPRGVAAGNKVRIPGKGDFALNIPRPGDLYVTVEQQGESLFTREGADLFLDQAVTFSEAALGAILEIRSIEGQLLKVKVPAGVQDGAKIRVPNKGMPLPHDGGNGHLIIAIRVKTPTKLTEETRNIFDRLNELAKKRDI